jgi:hypothetical protein
MYTLTDILTRRKAILNLVTSTVAIAVLHVVPISALVSRPAQPVLQQTFSVKKLSCTYQPGERSVRILQKRSYSAAVVNSVPKGGDYFEASKLNHETASVQVRDNTSSVDICDSVMPDTEDIPLLWATARESHQTGELLQRIFLTVYNPRAWSAENAFMDRVQTQRKGNVQVKVAVLGTRESREFFGVSMAKHGIQPVWIEIDNSLSSEDGQVNGETTDLFLDRVKMDPNYFPPREAANKCHFMNLKQLAGVGLFSWFIFLPLTAILPLKWLTAFAANNLVDTFFCKHSFPNGFIKRRTIERGFIFTSVDNGAKVVNVALLGQYSHTSFEFRVPIPGLSLDYKGKTPSLEGIYQDHKEKKLPIECDLKLLKECLATKQPRAVSNANSSNEGDPTNLVIVGDFKTLLAAFGSRWDETEVISLSSCWKTVKSFVLGSQYRYSPVSALYMYGRCQDIALQRARNTISERLHLRLWLSTLQFEGGPVWVGQISRDIGVRFAKTWNLTTHQIDPSVDEARNYVIADLLRSGHLDRVGYVDGVGESDEENPRRNLTGDPYVTDGKRAVIILSPTKTKSSKLLDW